MSTQEDRIASLERKVAALELRRMYEEGLAQENTPLEQGHNLREINENMTILLGVVGKQGLAVREVKENMELRFDVVDARFNKIEAEIGTVGTEINTVKAEVSSVRTDMVSMEGRILNAFQQLVAIIDTRLPPQEK